MIYDRMSVMLYVKRKQTSRYLGHTCKICIMGNERYGSKKDLQHSCAIVTLAFRGLHDVCTLYAAENGCCVVDHKARHLKMRCHLEDA